MPNPYKKKLNKKIWISKHDSNNLNSHPLYVITKIKKMLLSSFEVNENNLFQIHLIIQHQIHYLEVRTLALLMSF